MNEPPFSCSEMIERLGGVLEVIFRHFQVPEREAQEILEEACQTLLYKRSHWFNPEGWLLGTVIQRCDELTRGGTGEDPPE